jgi:hypothetical protein
VRVIPNLFFIIIFLFSSWPRLQEETGQAESVVFHALAVASGDPALALLYLRGRRTFTLAFLGLMLMFLLYGLCCVSPRLMSLVVTRRDVVRAVDAR